MCRHVTVMGASKDCNLLTPFSDCKDNRYAPPTYRLGPRENAYVITETRLKEIRSEFLYCFFDKGGDDGNGDYQQDIHNSVPQIHKNFNFQLPFFGFRFNYTRVCNFKQILSFHSCLSHFKSHNCDIELCNVQ